MNMTHEWHVNTNEYEHELMENVLQYINIQVKKIYEKASMCRQL